MDGNSYTPIERKLLDVLADGQPHTRDELMKAHGDIIVARQAIQGHLSRIRKRLRPQGLDILCVLRHRRIHYQQVRLLCAAQV